MDSKERAELIRKGNALFNEKKYSEAEKLFVKTRYKDGLIRIGDYLFYEKKMPLAAFKYYKMAGNSKKTTEIYERMTFALKKWISGEEKEDEDNSIHLEPVTVHPKLKMLAEEILERNKKEQKP
jgi:hypothetical protein